MPPPGSPTEIVDESDDELTEMKPEQGEEPHGGSGEMLAVMAVDATGGSPNRTKRAREQETRNGRARDGRGSRRGVDEEDEDDAVPARRPLSPGGDQPVTSREFRALLAQHFAEFSRSWQPMEHRIAGVEQETKSSKQEHAVLTSRVTQVERKEADLETKVHDLAKTVEDLKKEGVKQSSGAGCRPEVRRPPGGAASRCTCSHVEGHPGGEVEPRRSRFHHCRRGYQEHVGRFPEDDLCHGLAQSAQDRLQCAPGTQGRQRQAHELGMG